MIARNLKLDANGDLAVENGRLVLVYDEDSIAQAVQCRLRTFMGEWYLDPTLGTPYYQRILGKQANPQILVTIFRSVIESVPGVKDVTDIAFDFDGSTRLLGLTWTGTTDLGELTASVRFDSQGAAQ